MEKAESSNPLLNYWGWLDGLDLVAREAVLAEDKDADGRCDPDFTGQTVCYILDRCNTFDEFWNYLKQIDRYDKDEAYLFWNIYMKGMLRLEEGLKKDANN